MRTPHTLNKLKDGTQAWYKFDNEFGASVVSHEYSYGGKDGLYELAVTKFDRETSSWNITYSTPITDDVLGYLSESDVDDILDRIENLDNRDMHKSLEEWRLFDQS